MDITNPKFSEYLEKQKDFLEKSRREENVANAVNHVQSGNEPCTIVIELSILKPWKDKEVEKLMEKLSNQLQKLQEANEESKSVTKASAMKAAAKNEIAAAEQEKLEKERLAQKALGEQEQLMDAIVQESMKLQQEADENSKLREFLMDRGRIVDVLQSNLRRLLLKLG
ncbi:hypothetical protein J5N97_025049 [Dioscorea zingiberensis]|uniref:Uncharacterized protein n=1 Tax=Dioscorea zingiberensis TaxID=325984 RepID=A0A9D5H9G6_9LILI|nr:hypothetical protein J5N97_025049 [Dioscorea zingiberensis]